MTCCGNYWLEKSLNDELNEYAVHELKQRSLWLHGERRRVPSLADVFHRINKKAQQQKKNRVSLDIMTFGKNKMEFTLNVEIIESPLAKGCEEPKRKEDGVLKVRITGKDMTPNVWHFLNGRYDKGTAILWYETFDPIRSEWQPTEVHTLQNVKVQSYRTTNFPEDDCVEMCLHHKSIRGNKWHKKN